MKKIIVTSSWDDGHKLDFRLARLLEKYGIKGTFYIAKEHNKGPMKENEIVEFSKTQEIGAHTLTHSELDKINLSKVKEEIFGSKIYLENLLKREVKMFCYPRGLFNKEIENIVKSAGFLGARSTQKFCIKKPLDFYNFGVSSHTYPFPLRKKDNKNFLLNRNLFVPLRNNYRKIIELKLPWRSFVSWNNFANNFFDYAAAKGEMYHLYGHSWEIERYGMWHNLERHLEYISRRDDVLYLDNSETLDFFKNN